MRPQGQCRQDGSREPENQQTRSARGNYSLTFVERRSLAWFIALRLAVWEFLVGLDLLSGLFLNYPTRAGHVRFFSLSFFRDSKARL